MKLLWATAFAILSFVALAPGEAGAQDYRLRPGDVVRVEVIEDPSLNRDVLISPDGQISFPLAGNIRAGGRTIEQIQSTLTAALEDDFAVTPSVFVGLSSLAQEEPRVPQEPVEPETYNVYMLGEIANSGLIQVEPGTTILQAFALAGGFSDFAATKRIQLRRTDAQGVPQIYRLNYKAIENGTSPNGQLMVAPGDTFIVPTRRLFE
ncbi:polysaccharide biosynthesis/export family protein [Palleronia sp. LCG004]|uniref:polysaccharide biosynthesis/export family protein n=1 Tax=Palleronia sp. LCG004 TaxID=3079304 RepID=UPI00294218DF|nr:polysaccharide biosynthesis/export family protein [Palleronia sp. LCG004]WOI58417.1 polysaccharide biosynthesis/export family protein [Palleronia sp. LCG004]